MRLPPDPADRALDPREYGEGEEPPALQFYRMFADDPKASDSKRAEGLQEYLSQNIRSSPRDLQQHCGPDGFEQEKVAVQLLAEIYLARGEVFRAVELYREAGVTPLPEQKFIAAVRVLLPPTPNREWTKPKVYQALAALDAAGFSDSPTLLLDYAKKQTEHQFQLVQTAVHEGNTSQYASIASPNSQKMPTPSTYRDLRKALQQNNFEFVLEMFGYYGVNLTDLVSAQWAALATAALEKGEVIKAVYMFERAKIDPPAELPAKAEMDLHYLDNVEWGDNDCDMDMDAYYAGNALMGRAPKNISGYLMDRLIDAADRAVCSAIFAEKEKSKGHLTGGEYDEWLARKLLFIVASSEYQ